MKVYLIHCTSVAGHHLEYIHHLYMGALARQDNEYHFVLPAAFQDKKYIFNWPETDHIHIDILDIEDGVDDLGLLKKSWLKARSLGKYIKRFRITHVILIDLISYIPFLPLFVPFRIKVRGILYRIYLYDWPVSNWKKKSEDIVKYLIFSRLKVFDKVFLLNDSTAAAYLNKLYKTNTFHFLPDPVASSREYKPRDIRGRYNISSDEIVYLHPGGMLPYKGSLDILRALCEMEKSALSNVVVLFAGRVTPNIKEKFFEMFEELKKKMHIVLIEGFLPFEDLADLFFSCDFVLIPYKVKSQSSGIVGHSAFYHKPVIVAREGVIGKTVRKWKLGYILKEPSASEIKHFIEKPQYCEVDGSSYVLSHSVERFCEIIYQ